MGRFCLFLGALALLAGCGGGGNPAQLAEDLAQFERTRAEIRQLDAELDELEARLYGGKANVRLWAELADRHGKVSEVACRNLTEQSDSIATILRREGRKATRRLAQGPKTGAVMTDAHVSGYEPARTAVPAAGKLEP